ncbi:MAG: acyltransferase [Bacteroidales bacterium]|nr:acyltransferase [Bacteroidales bacterium]
MRKLISENRLPVKKIILIGLLPSFLKKLVYKMKGYKIGNNVFFSLGSIIDVKEKCEIGNNCTFGFFSIITGNEFVIGKRCKIRPMTIIMCPKTTMGNDVIISESAIIRAQQPFPDSEIEIDDRVHIFPNSIIDPSKPIYIGKETAVGFSSYIFTHGAYKDKLNGYPVVYGKVSLGKAVWIPCNVFIMPGVELGDDVVVGTGSIVTKSFEAGSFIMGQPAKLIKTREQFVRSYTDEQKFDILKGIMAEFAEHLRYFSNAEVSPVNELKYIVSTKGRSTAYELHLDSNSISNPDKNTVYLVFGNISDETIHLLEKYNTSWFSTNRHQCSEHLTELADSLKNYLRRYGIYFERR